MRLECVSREERVEDESGIWQSAALDCLGYDTARVGRVGSTESREQRVVVGPIRLSVPEFVTHVR